MVRLRVLLGGLLVASSIACGPAAPTQVPTPSSAASPGGLASIGPTASSPSPATTPSATPTPTGTPGATAASPPPLPSTAAEFWAVATQALVSAVRVRLVVSGPSPGEIRYEATASATYLDDHPIFVCLVGIAYDGQNQFEPVPGTWSCGAAAIRDGFQNLGQPLDAWSRDFEANSGIRERLALEADGRWRWDYAAQSPQYGGRVTASVWLDPATGRILKASRVDPIGTSTYRFEYGASFAPIALPGT